MSEPELEDINIEEKSRKELREMLDAIADECLFKAAGNGRVRSPEKERVRIKYLRVARSTIETHLEDKRMKDAEQAASINSDEGSHSHVYVITDGENHKIGISSDPENRLSQLQCSNPKRLELVTSATVEDAPAIEAYLHEKYSEHNVHGEWFDMPRHIAQQCVDDVKDLQDNE